MRTTSILSICVLFFACSTPLELLEKGQVERAFKLAKKKLKAGKDIGSNSKVLISTGHQIIQNELYNNFPLIESPHVEDWVRAQNNYFKTLEDIVVANDLVDGQLQNSYDQLCTQKIELDFKIADHFFQNGDELLATHYESTSKHHAREAYYQYQECLSFGGDRFFQDIEDKKEECVYQGRVYFISRDFWPSTNLFFQPLPQNAAFEPDCSIHLSIGRTSYSTQTTEHIQKHSKDIKVGQQAETDTSGNISYTPIYETVYADLVTRNIEVNLSCYTTIYADNITGQCSKSDNTFNTCVSDSYKEVRIYGDKRAVSSAISICQGQPTFFMSNLESDLQSKIDTELNFW